MAKSSSDSAIVTNRRATFDYEIEERYEAGIVLVGSEVKSMRAGRVDIVDSYASIEGNEAFLKQLYVAPLEYAKAFPHEPRRSRKLLLHAREIEVLKRAQTRGGYTLVPLRLYLKEGRVKVEIGVAKGKKTYDKRSELAKKTADREARDAIARGRKGND